MKKIRIGFAGLRHGHIFGLYNLALQNEYLDVAGVFEDSPEGMAEAEKNNVAVTHTDYKSLLAEVDAVAVGTFYADRGRLCVEALEAGKHVIADKPLCTRLDELAKIRELAEKKSLTVGMMLDLRDNKNVVAAKELTDSGEIGKINNICFQGYHPLMYGVRPDWYFEKGKHGGVINDIAIHGVDLVRRFTGSDLDTVIGARCWNFYAKQCRYFRDSAQFMLKMSNGAGVIADVSYATPDNHGYNIPLYWNFAISGEKGMITFNAASEGVSLYKLGSEPVIVKGKQPDRIYLDDIVDEIMNPAERTVTTETLRSAEQTLLIQKSADRNDG